MGFPFVASYIAVWILVIFQGLLILALLKHLAEVKQLARLGGVAGADPLPAGAPAPDFEGVDLRSAKRLTKQIFAGRGGLLLLYRKSVVYGRKLGLCGRSECVNSV